MGGSQSLARGFVGASALLLVLLPPPVFAQSNPCSVVDDGSGTVTLPPAGCAYLSPTEVHMIIDGLPPGTTIELDPIHLRFINIVEVAGGALGGNSETFDSDLEFEITGTGDLSGFSRSITLPVAVETETAPRTGGNPIQTFDTEMASLSGSLVGDPDFCTLNITGGRDEVGASPGQTTLTELPSGNFNVDSFFDIDYRIEFVGCPGSSLDGLSGTTDGSIRMESGVPAASTCFAPDNGTGTVSLPPADCGYVSPADLHMMIAGLPPGTTIELAPAHRTFTNVAEGPGGFLGGNLETFDSDLDFELRGTGDLDGFLRQLTIPASVQTQTGPRTPGDPVQTFPTEMVQLQGALFGDPDFDELQIQVGPGFGLPSSPGQTTLTQMPDGDFNVDSFFDISYRIDFIGAPGGALDGLSGSTEGSLQMEARSDPAASEACCLPGDQCLDVRPLDCTNFQGATLGIGTDCETSSCIPPVECPETPSSGCVTGEKSKMQLDAKNPGKHKLKFKQSKGDQVDLAQLGNPLLSTTYAFCVYDNGALIHSSQIGSGSEWKESSKLVLYKNKDGVGTGGLTSIKAKTGSAGKSSTQVAAKGDNFTSPALPVTGPIVAELLNSEGVCWQSQFNGPFKKNEATKFKAQSP